MLSCEQEVKTRSNWIDKSEKVSRRRFRSHFRFHTTRVVLKGRIRPRPLVIPTLKWLKIGDILPPTTYPTPANSRSTLKSWGLHFSSLLESSLTAKKCQIWKFWACSIRGTAANTKTNQHLLVSWIFRNSWSWSTCRRSSSAEPGPPGSGTSTRASCCPRHRQVWNEKIKCC